MKKIVITCSLLLSAVFNSNAATTGNYTNYYTEYKAGAFWVNVTEMGNTTVSNGLGIYDGSGTQGAGIISESMGYALMLAALYNDKTTFDKLSATIQAGIPYGSSKADGNGGFGTKTGLLPWSWTTSGNSAYYAYNNNSGQQYYNPYDSASDADINIALGYIYADKAKTVYGWSDPSSGSTYATMAKNYIAAIRLRDFTSASGQSDANKHILADGADKAADGFPGYSATWHPDYSDIRAYQLFSTYDTSYASFWQSAITYTKAAWKSVLSFGSTDTRTTMTSAPTSGQSISPASKNSWLTVNTFFINSFSSNYTSVIGTYYGQDYSNGGSSSQTYWTDCSRMPMRLMNYVNASENSDPDMQGMASALLSALGKTYKDQEYNSLTSSINIYTPFTQNYGSSNVQDFMGAGLLALSSNTQLSPLQGVCSRTDVYNNLVTDFGPNGDYLTNRAVNTDTSDDNVNDFTDPSKGFNCSLTLWGLTINKNSQNSLQRSIEAIETGIGTATNSISSSAEKPGSMSSTATTSSSINSGSTVAEVKEIVRSRIQAALATQGAANMEKIASVATILGVSKSNLSKALKLAPASVRSSNGKINIAKLGEFISKNSKAAELLTGKSKAKGKKTSAK
jgi:endo-1,4-beta-D-glucanase Y